MAELLTLKDLQDGHLDVKALGEAANGDENKQVVTRTGETYPSAKKAIKTMFKNGGLPATPFKTKALMTASALIDGDYAQVTDGGADNGLYNKTEGAWVKSAYDIVQIAKPYIDEQHVKSIEYFDNKQSMLSNKSKSAGQAAYVRDTNDYYKFEHIVVDRQVETTNLLARFTKTPSDTGANVINRLIYDLKQSGVWAKLDALYVARTMSLDDSKLNWIANSNNLVQNNAQSYYPVPKDSRWYFNSYNFDTGLNLSALSGVKYSSNHLSLGAIVKPSTLSKNIAGAYDGSSGTTLSYNIAIDTRVNQAAYSSSNKLAGVGNYSLIAAVRDADIVNVYQDNTLLSSETIASTTPINQTIKLGKISDTILSDSTDVYAFFVGKTLTASDINALNKALQLYMSQFAVPDAPTGFWDKQESISLAPDLTADVNALNNYIFDGVITATATNTVSNVIDDKIYHQEYMGGYVEIQPDSYNGGTVPATDNITDTWGFPQSLTYSEQARLRKDLFRGDGKGLQYIRLPLGYAYRGYRNIDPASGLARNVGERYLGQNAALRKLFADISKSGGGLAPEYWCPPVYWLTSGSYSGGNQITAGGAYPRSKTLSSIRASDPTQYAAQIDAFTDAIVDDYEYLHQNIAPVRMYGLSNEPAYSTQEYGACSFDAETYSDIVLALHPKVISSAILSEYNGEPNKPLLHVASDDESPYWSRAAKLEAQHPEYIWAYTHHMIRQLNGQTTPDPVNYFGGDYYASPEFAAAIGTRKNVFINEYEYFLPEQYPHRFKCANNMLVYISGLLYSDARVIMPIIHVCKQLGAASSSTNTDGYALVKCNLQKPYGFGVTDPKNAQGLYYGTYAPVTHNYNAWQFIADNLPIGAVRVGNVGVTKVPRCNHVVYKFEGKLYVFIVNSSDSAINVSLDFSANKNFYGKYYDVDSCGTTLKPKSGKTIVFIIPAYSGQAWVEV